MASMTKIYMSNVPELGDAWRELTAPLVCKMWPGYKGPECIDPGFRWNGHSAFILTPLYPRHNHPISSCKHDFRCEQATNAAERKWADEEYERDVGTTSRWITKKVGYLGVRFGALLGIGNRF